MKQKAHNKTKNDFISSRNMYSNYFKRQFFSKPNRSSEDEDQQAFRMNGRMSERGESIQFAIIFDFRLLYYI